MVKTFLRYWIGDVFYNSLYFGHRFVVGFAHDPGEYHINMSIHYLIQSWFETICYFITSYLNLPEILIWLSILRNFTNKFLEMIQSAQVMIQNDTLLLIRGKKLGLPDDWGRTYVIYSPPAQQQFLQNEEMLFMRYLPNTLHYLLEQVTGRFTTLGDVMRFGLTFLVHLWLLYNNVNYYAKFAPWSSVLIGEDRMNLNCIAFYPSINPW